MTNSQQVQFSIIISVLTGNYLCPSDFKNATVIKTDEFTDSVLVKLSFEEHTGQIWIRKKGEITDINGQNLKKNGLFCHLPTLKSV